MIRRRPITPSHGAPKVVSQQAIRILGSLTAVLLLVVLTIDLRSNLRAQWNESGRLANEVALSVAQMVHAPLRSSANALLVIAEESHHLQQTLPQQHDALMKNIIAAVVRRQPQVVDVALVDAAPSGETAASPEDGDGVWTSCGTNQPSTAAVPCFGSVEKASDGSMVLPLAASDDEGHRWVVGHIQIAALERSLASVPHAGNVFFSVTDAHGRVVLQGGKPGAVAGGAQMPWWMHWIDGRAFAPLQARAPVGSYPFTVEASVSSQDALAAWYRQLAAIVVFYLCYLAAFIGLLRVTSHATALQQHYIRSLQAASENLRVAQRVGRTAMWSLSDDAQRFECSEDAEELFGLPRGTPMTSVKDMLTMVAPVDRPPLMQRIREAWNSGAPLRTEFRLHLDDGSVRCLSAGGQVVIDEHGVRRMTGTVVDVTEQWEARRLQRESEDRFDVLFEQNPLPFWVFDVATLRILEVNAAALRAYGYTREEFLAMSILDLRDPGDHPSVVAHVAAPSEARETPRIWVHRTKTGAPISVRIHSADIMFADRPARLILAEDVTAHLADERELVYRASHDLITGLPNQHALMEWMDVRIAAGAPFDVAYLQLVGMDAIADTFGINVSTGILQVVAARLAQLSDGHGYLAAITHQSFALSDAKRLSDSLLQAMADCIAEPIYYKDTQHQISVVIGVAHYPQDSIQSDALLARAALAAHSHLHSDEPIHYFEPAMAQQSKEKLHFSASLRRAVKRQEFELHFQPIAHFPSLRASGLEALIRWPQSDGSYIFPSSFIPLCEESGLIVPLGQWVLEQAAKASRELKDAGFDLPIAINVSPTELRSRDLVTNLRAVRSMYSLADHALRIELTESSLIEHRDKAIAVMKELRAEGVVVALDDFGTGFSGLSYLRDLPIDILKIDQAFVRNVDRDARSATICEAIIALGKSLKVSIVAEGIERYSQYRWLNNHGCDAAQGFYVGRPEKLSNLLAQWSRVKDDVR
jgi:PAS domain S-box-containing protein